MNLDYLSPRPFENRTSDIEGHRVEQLNDAEFAKWLDTAERKLTRWLQQDNGRRGPR